MQDFDERFWKLETELQHKNGYFLLNSPELEKAKILLIGAATINQIIFGVEENEKLSENCLVKIHGLFLVKAFNYFIAAYELTKSFYYNPAYSIIRSNYELLLLLKLLTREPERAKELHKEIIACIEAQPNQNVPTLKKPKYVDTISDLIKKEKSSYGEINSDFYNFISNVSTHPHQIDQIALDSKPNPELEKQVLSLAIGIFYGYLLLIGFTYKDYLKQEMRESINFLLDKIEKQIPEGIPTFVIDGMPQEITRHYNPAKPNSQ